MANNSADPNRAAIGAWAKRCYFAGRAMMEATLRPYETGATQWYIMFHLANVGPTMQRDLVRLLEIERATVSIILGTLVRKGLVEQTPDTKDQRQKLLCLTPAGKELWERLPNLEFIRKIAFDGFSKTEIEIAVRVLRTATERLN